MEAATTLLHHAVLTSATLVHHSTVHSVAALSKSSVKHTLDTGLTVTGLVLVGIGSLVAKRKQQRQQK